MIILRQENWTSSNSDLEIDNVDKVNVSKDLINTVSDEQNLNLLKSVADGNRDACQEFVVSHYQWLTVIVRQQFPYSDLYMDIVHDAFGLTIEKLKANEIKKLESIKYYLRTAALNIGYSYMRKDKKFRSNLDQELLFVLEDTTANVEREAERESDIDYVKQLIREMKVERDQEILKAFYLENKDKLSICQELEIMPDHFSRVLFRAKHRLKELLMSKKENNKDNVVSIFSNKLGFIGFVGSILGMMLGVIK